MPEFYTRAKAADFLVEQGYPTTKKSLDKLATVGGGPVFQKWGPRALYTAPNLIKWARSKLSEPHASTSEAAKSSDESEDIDDDVSVGRNYEPGIEPEPEGGLAERASADPEAA